MREFTNTKFNKNDIKGIETLPEKLQSILMKGFGKCGEVIFAIGLANPSIESISNLLAVSSDMTGIECNINKIHIEDFIAKTGVYNHDNILSYGITFTKQMASAISLQFPCDPIRFILTEERGEFPSVVFRFHKIRYGESWLAEDIDKYDSGIFVLDTE